MRQDIRRYALFGWPDSHEAGGGWHDFQGVYSSIEEALGARKAILDEQILQYECWEVVDLQTLKVIIEEPPRQRFLE